MSVEVDEKFTSDLPNTYETSVTEHPKIKSTIGMNLIDLTNLVNELTDTKFKLSQSETKLTTAENKISFLTNEISNKWEKEVNELKEERETLKDKIAVLTGEISRLEKIISEQDSKIDKQNIKIKKLETGIEDLKYVVSTFVNNCSIYELMTKLDKYIIREVYDRETMISGYNLGNLSMDIKKNKLTLDEQQRLKIISDRLDGNSLSTIMKLNEAIWGYREIRVNVIHKKYQHNLNRLQYYEMSDEICQRGGIDIDNWKIKGRAIIDLAFTFLTDKPFDTQL